MIAAPTSSLSSSSVESSAVDTFIAADSNCSTSINPLVAVSPTTTKFDQQQSKHYSNNLRQRRQPHPKPITKFRDSPTINHQFQRMHNPYCYKYQQDEEPEQRVKALTKLYQPPKDLRKKQQKHLVLVKRDNLPSQQIISSHPQKEVVYNSDTLQKNPSFLRDLADANGSKGRLSGFVRRFVLRPVMKPFRNVRGLINIIQF